MKIICILLGFSVLIGFLAYLLFRTQKALNEERIKKIGSIGPMTDYIKFISNFKQAEKNEKKGKKREAIKFYQRALENLGQIKDNDDLVQENIESITSKIKMLE